MNHSEPNAGQRAGSWLLACAFAACAAYPAITRSLEAHRAARAVEAARGKHATQSRKASRETELSLRVERLDGLVASWQTIGGCGAGTSTSSGGGLKWIGHSVTGGLFNLQTQSSYSHLNDGYVLTF